MTHNLVHAAPGAKGKFITLEGLEGAGKSTQISRIEAKLQSAGHAVLCTREPGGTRLGESLRAILLAPDQGPMNVESELLMMFAARAQHLNEVVWPALDKGIWVICDRFTDASFAYQGGGRGLDTARIEQLETWVQGAFRPDLCILLDLPVAQGLARAAARGSADRFEMEGEAFFGRVRSSYLARAAQYASRYAVVDAGESIENVTKAILRALERVLQPV